ncbi:MAG: streptogramin lyase [Myxococcota bacterium]|jgi:streptogramin lyase
MASRVRWTRAVYGVEKMKSCAPLSVLILASALACAGCGSEKDNPLKGALADVLSQSDAQTGTTDGAADGSTTSTGEDGSTTTGDGTGSTGGQGDTGGNTASETDGDSGDDGGPDLPADFNKPCENNDQCTTGLCIEGPDGKVCSMLCITACPEDWECEPVTNFGGDVTYMCVPKFASLCQECSSNADCGGAKSRCIDIAPEGAHCTRECSLEEPCTTGYLCKAFDDITNLCFPNTGSCICTPDLLGTSEDCFSENVHGICKGAITCDGPGGWSECNAAEPAAEICDAVDNDCDNEIDEGVDGQPCQNTNEFGACLGVIACQGAAGNICTAGVPAQEQCGDGADNDCNGFIDEEGGAGCLQYFQDIDKDGLGNAVSSACLCVPNGSFTAVSAGDCNDLNPNVSQGKPEICNTLDDDCDGEVDPENSIGCIFFYKDDDGDGYGQAANAKCLCGPTKQWTAPVSGDCDDTNAGAHPGAFEICDTFDNNCNGVADEANSVGCQPYLKDADNDGFGVTSITQCLCEPAGFWTASSPGDCDDTDDAVHPGGLEICDGVDNSCNGTVDEDCDKDSDGYCNALKPIIGTPFSCPNGGGDCVDFNPNIHPNAAEVCDEVDNDCDLEIDEGVQAPCGGCANVCIMGAGPDGDDGFEETEEQVFDGAGKDDDGNIVLDTSTIQLTMIWVSNSGEGTVSKLNTTTGDEVARYTLCADPSRTAVDTFGNAWIGCRGDSQVVKVALSIDDCVDKNGNGVIDTSSDLDGNKIIDAAEMLPTGEDECVLFKVQPDGAAANARALGIDKDNNAWVGMWNTSTLWKLEKDTGAVLKQIAIPGNSYGIALDQNGTIWVADRGLGQLLSVDPDTSEIKTFHPGGTYSPYGMTIDENGRIWTANCCSNHMAMRFDPVTETWAGAPMNARPRGMAANGKGFVFVANDESHQVAKVDINTMETVGFLSVGAERFPVGMAVDFDGKVWAINQSSSTASRIDPDTMTVEFEVPTGPSPYTYSDMTGFQQKTVVAPTGTYRHVFTGWDNNPTQWMQVGLELELPEGTSADLRVRVASTKADLADALWTPHFGPFPPELPTVNLSTFGAVIGRFMEVEVTLQSEDSTTTPVLKSIDIVAAPFD